MCPGRRLDRHSLRRPPCVLGRSHHELGLESLVETEAVLADGSKVSLETFICFADWFGERIPVQVIANDGKYPLLGTGLLEGRQLSINYVTKELSLD